MPTEDHTPLDRLRNLPQRVQDEYVRLQQRREQAAAQNDHLRPWIDRIGYARQERTDEINRRRRADGTARLLYYVPTQPLGNQWSARRINYLATHLPRSHRYLEIGVFRGETFEQVRMLRRYGVEPFPLFDLKALPRLSKMSVTTSDDFFRQLDRSTHFDIAFVDGLHTMEQTYRDIINTFAHVPRGPILIDDTVPSDEFSAIPDQEESYRKREAAGLTDRPWHGDVCRVMLLINEHHPELDWRTITNDGNPQTVIWRRIPGAAVVSADPSRIEDAKNVDYNDVFADGPPKFFHPTSEETALTECVAALTKDD